MARDGAEEGLITLNLTEKSWPCNQPHDDFAHGHRRISIFDVEPVNWSGSKHEKDMLSKGGIARMVMNRFE